MKVCVIQPPYSKRESDAEECFQKMLSLMEECDESLDLIVLPEYCDVPTDTEGEQSYKAMLRHYRPIIDREVRKLARRCRAMVFANYGEPTEKGFRNTTHCFDREGVETGKYYKAHPAPSETKTAEEGGNELDCAYSYSYEKPYILEMEGLKFAFMTCYDFYMYEEYSQIARENVDIIIGCSHQRTDTHSALEIIGRFLSYQTNAYLIRSAVSMGEDSPVCGCSMIVNPKGEMLVDMKNRVGLGICEIEPSVKYRKPAGYLGAMKAHHEYIDEGRRPWLYRPAGSMMIPDDAHLPYPRICAHRGFNTVAPENSMPAFGAAVAMGAEEIELDLWSTTDGKLVSIHDPTLERVSNGLGKVYEHSLAELKALDFGGGMRAEFAGLRILEFEDVLKKFSGSVIMNIHVKIWDEPNMDHRYRQIADLLRQYNCERHCYMMCSTPESFREFHEIAPEIRLCMGWDGEKKDFNRIVDNALYAGAQKVQLFKPYFDESTVEYAHEKGLICNVFFADDPEEAVKYRKMGVECILTNDYHRVSEAVRGAEKQ